MKAALHVPPRPASTVTIEMTETEARVIYEEICRVIRRMPPTFRADFRGNPAVGGLLAHLSSVLYPTGSPGPLPPADPSAHF